MSGAVADFWAEIEKSTNPTAYRPQRNEQVIIARLETNGTPYYVLKEPLSQSYLRLSEADYALWWQMNGEKSIKDLLFYSLTRYQSLPIGRLNSLIADLRAGHFLTDPPVNLYTQIEKQLEARAPASRGRRILNGFLHTEIALGGLDDLFVPLYRSLKQLFQLSVQWLLLVVIVIGGGVLFARLFWQQRFALSGSGGLGLISLFAANLVVITIHELAHGLMTKHFGRQLNRGGFLVYWGMPALFVDTRDIWLSPRLARIAVSWAGPHSGLLIGGLVGGILTAMVTYYPEFSQTIWTGLLYQMGFLAYLSVFVNLNPLMELDGYFIMMDWLEMPGLRQRAIRFWRDELWTRLRTGKSPAQFWKSLHRAERIYCWFGGLTLVYSIYALIFALYFWQTRLFPFAVSLWRDYGFMGQLLVMLLTALIILPGFYYITRFSWSQIESGLEWLARRDLLARPDVLALTIGLSLFGGLTLLLLLLSSLHQSDLWLDLVTWLLHLAAILTLAAVARQLSGSRFQWAIWSLMFAPVGLTIAWISSSGLWHDLGLLMAATGILGTGTVSWFTVWPKHLERSDRLLMILLLILGAGYGAGLYSRVGSLEIPMTLVLLGVVAGLILLAPMWLNFWRSRFALPWFLLVLAILSVPLLPLYASLHFAVTLLWLYAGLLYLALGILAQFGRQVVSSSETSVFQERERLINGFNHFMQSLFASYETVFGGRRLGIIQTQMIALGALDPDAGILQIAQRCRAALLLAVDRLDDLAGTQFTRQAGQAAYDSLPWLEAETLARHLLSETEWGSQLAQGFITAQDSRTTLIRQADIFAGFDQAAVQEVAAVLTVQEFRSGSLLAQAGHDARHFVLVEAGEVGVFHEGTQMAVLNAGGYFGTLALLDEGNYQFTYRALTSVRALMLRRDQFNPLLRRNTTLSGRVSSGAETRSLLKKMVLFSSLSPQQLATLDARLTHRTVTAGEIIARQGEPRSHLFIIAGGQVEVSHEEDGQYEIAGTLGPGEHFGEYALFADTPYNDTYRAVDEVKLLLLDEDTFDQLVAGCASMSHYVEQIGSGRLVATRRRLSPSAIVS